MRGAMDPQQQRQEVARGLVAAGYLFALATMGAVAALAYFALRAVPIERLVPLIIGAVASALVAIGCSFVAMMRRAGADGSHALFDTWFPLLMAAVPVAGPFIALWSAVKLLVRDKLTAATITTSSGHSRSISHHDDCPLYGSGRPAGLVLATLALVQPVAALAAFGQFFSAFNLSPVEMEWKEGTLECTTRGAYRAADRTFDISQGTLLRVGGSCSVRLERCTLIGPEVARLDGEARVTLVDCKVATQEPIRVDEQAELTISGGAVTAGGTGASALWVNNSAGLTLDGVAVQGGIIGRASARIQVKKGTVDLSQTTSHSTGLDLRNSAKPTVAGTTIKGWNAASLRDQATLVLDGGRLEGKREALNLRDSSKVKAKGTVVVGRRAVVARNKASLALERGTVHGETAVTAYQDSRVVLAGSKVMGRLNPRGGTIKRTRAGTGADEALAAAERRLKLAERKKRLVERYGKLACHGILDCYDGHEGRVGGKVRSTVGDDGKVTSVDVKLEQTPDPIARCIKGLAQNRHIPNFQGPAGTLRCTFSGSVLAKSQVVRTNGAYIPDPTSSVHNEAPSGGR